MAEHRTRQQKVVAKLRRELELVSKNKNVGYQIAVDLKDKNASAKPIFYQPELSLPVKMVWLDLTKTVGVTILALAFQIGLSVWLSRGGWQWINNLWFAKLIK